ncbi:uncharacterized protein LOC132903548 [Amyelois transitella]|uniref:uncharacterized protein LOC132903548 n=1 Tax=Amyelois transitella TaxID=680683 RepID=UPI0029903CA3|nr:uncharacterized protein LOC132903548 [Amyelois transitella]
MSSSCYANFTDITVLTFQFSTSYVLLEVSKDDRNQSEVNAYVHKVIPAKSDHRTVAKSKVRRFEVKKRADDVARNTNPTLESDRSEKTVVVINQAFDALKSIVEKPEFRAIKNLSFIENIIEAAREFVNAPAFRSSKTMRYIDKVIDIVKEAAFGPAYRTGGVPENLKTELVHFRNGQPSMVFEVKTNFVVDFVRKMLSSHLIERYMDDMEMMPAANQHHSSVRRHPKKYLPNYDKKMRAEDEELNDEPNMRSKQIIRTVDDTFDALKKLANRPEFRSRKTAALVDSDLDASLVKQAVKMRHNLIR